MPRFRSAMFCAGALCAQPALADKMIAVTPSGATEQVFSGDSKSVVGKLSSGCIDVHWTVVSSGDTDLVCEVKLNFGQSVLGQLLLGNSYSTPPRQFVRFNVAQTSGVSRVQVSGWMEVQMAFGQTRRTEISGPDFHNNMMIFMQRLGGLPPIGTTYPNHVAVGLAAANVGDDKGVRVSNISADGAAKHAGIMDGDIITSFAGKRVKNGKNFLDALEHAVRFETYPVEILREGKRIKLTLNKVMRGPQTDAPAPIDVAQASASAASSSIADEFEKLSSLHASGALTDEEFDAAKAKLLAD